MNRRCRQRKVRGQRGGGQGSEEAARWAHGEDAVDGRRSDSARGLVRAVEQRAEAGLLQGCR